MSNLCTLIPLCVPVPIDLQSRPQRCSAGSDVARKAVILAREAGLQLELEDAEVQSLVPEPLRAAQSAAEFLDGLPQVRLPGTSIWGCWGMDEQISELEDVAEHSLVTEPPDSGKDCCRGS